jgi:hypothetical protein
MSLDRGNPAAERHRFRTPVAPPFPGLFFAANAFAAYAFVIDYEADWLETLSLVLVVLGLLWVAIGPFFAYSFIKEARRMGRSIPLTIERRAGVKAEKGLTKAEILVIAGTYRPPAEPAPRVLLRPSAGPWVVAALEHGGASSWDERS